MAKSAIGYVRVSTEEQATECVLLHAQQAKIQAWCLANDVELGNVFIDSGLSGSRADNRPQLQAALQNSREIDRRPSVAKISQILVDV
jgi:site-specific DNA recombinase